MNIAERDWRDLEAERHSSGVVSKRLYPSSRHDLFIAIDQLTGHRMLVVRTTTQDATAALRRLRALPRTRGLQLQFTGLADGHRELHIMLTTDDLREVFNPLVADIAATAQSAPDGTEALVSSVQRFEHWRNLLQTVGEHGLSPESRRGLYGELLVLRNHLLPALPPADALMSWTGPKMTNQDFQVANCAIEVKTNSTNNHRPSLSRTSASSTRPEWNT